ncbi:MAG: hypothetical protein P8I55_06580 [Crocinitomix sp.]|nr:hypothetical protein [Crocinitomix sp.]
MTNLPKHKYEFNEIYRDQYFTLHFNKELALAICTADSEYVPINEFKKVFLYISEFTKESIINHFIFDKRNLRTFHQPSMEWYYAIWKPKIKKYGLVAHYKILPKLEWFTKAVEAGKHEIFQKYGTDLLIGISVNYINSTDELILQLDKEKNTSP